MRKPKEYKKLKAFVYFFLRIIAVFYLFRQFFLENYFGSFICLLVLILSFLPAIMRKKLDIHLPDILEIVLLLFIFASEILGEVNEFYLHVRNFDTLLHTINGFIMAAVGFSVIDILNYKKSNYFALSKVYVIVASICFSMTIGVLWEFFEYGMDKYFKLDMQKDTVIREINSSLLNEEGIFVNTLVVNDEDWVYNYGGYIDIGLNDTMKDLLVNFLGALSYSIWGYFYLIGEDNTAENFILKYKKRKVAKC